MTIQQTLFYLLYFFVSFAYIFDLPFFVYLTYVNALSLKTYLYSLRRVAAKIPLMFRIRIVFRDIIANCVSYLKYLIIWYTNWYISIYALLGESKMYL